MATVLACVFPRGTKDEPGGHYDSCTPIQDLVASGLPEGAQVKVLVRPSFAELQDAIAGARPRLLYISGESSFEQDSISGTVGPLQFADGPQSTDAIAAASSGVEAVYLDCGCQEEAGAKLQAAGIAHAITWPDHSPVPAVTAAQFSHTFFCSLLHLKATVPEAFALASHVTQAHCGRSLDGQYHSPPLPLLTSASKANLPDNSSITPPAIPGVDPAVPLASSVAGWPDIRLLAPRAELHLLLTGDSTLIDSTRLSYLGEAVRALLVLEMRGLTLTRFAPCSQTPANLPLGCEAVRCEVRSTSGAEVVAVLGGQPSVLAEQPLVEHALRMTLVADSLSLQFRLPPPGVPMPQARQSVTVAGGTPVIDTLVLTSVWAVQILRMLCQMPSYRCLLSLGVAAVGSSPTEGGSKEDAQRLKMIVMGLGPAELQARTSAPQGIIAPPPPMPPPPASDGNEITAGA